MSSNLKTYQPSRFLRVVIDFIILLVSFCIVFWFKKGHFEFDPIYLNYLYLYVFTWFVANLVTRKYRTIKSHVFLSIIRPYLVAVFIMAGLLSLFAYGFKWFALSRFVVFGSLGIFFIVEMALLAFIYLLPHVLRREKKSLQLSVIFFVMDIILITATFLAVYFYKRGDLFLSDDYKILMFIIYMSWLFVGLFTHRFQIYNRNGIIRALWPFVKSFIIVLSFLSFFVFAFRITEFSRLILFGSITLFAVFEWMVVTIYYLYSHPASTDEVQTDYFHINELLDVTAVEEVEEEEKPQPVKGKYFLPYANTSSDALADSLKNIYLKHFEEVYTFIHHTLNLETFDLTRSVILRSGDPYNVEILPKDSLDMFVNLHEVNDFRRINQYFIKVNHVLKDGAVFIGKMEPIARRLRRFRKKYPTYLANVIYLVDFLWRRIFPKLPFVQKIYFSFTKGRDRALSKAEGLGRLYFCGFEILGLQEVDNFLYFIVRKIKEPSLDENPSYSPLFKMKRRGQFGVPIYVYKFRTMHPYSEYLQPYITDMYGYNNRGKILNDFRVTSWGRIFRKYWLDELPQLINFFKGEMRLVGIRPLSDRFLKEYPKEMLEMRFKHKPGCLPPYVALKKQAVDEYIESERIYLAEKEKQPILTDVKYFFWGVYNILTNKIRSM